ncbi:glycerol-3-phosphate responsive antiterminator [Peribacillus deserti]|uniref:Glycerol uptake operon antiterminator regulatory protein n=1 Tax=Peribacillus deserti TaxID=673318 RepID=A0A2N5M5Y2_9BACI|nr:glycerol-3-phosphate responsive antiterminator [Peribacillus deserti]PLT29771.1 glycerol-3-phosphate responsive antiterminator GlpP [Peribacillus deserti]
MQRILPASTSIKDFEKFLESPYEMGIFLDLHIAQLKHIAKMARQQNKKMIYHVDLIQGLKNDEYGTEFVCQEFKPYGLISTKSSVILKAKQKGVMAIQRMFLLDSHALEKTYSIIERTKPDYVEVLPGLMPCMIKEVKDRTGTNIIAGGLIRTVEEAQQVLNAGAEFISTSKKELWDHYKD